MRYLMLILLGFSLSCLFAQDVRFSSDIAPIIYAKCSYCHQKNGAAPFALTNYMEIEKNVMTILYAIDHNFMPPWKANDGHKYINYRGLSKEELNKIKTWVKEGYKNDKTALVYKPEKNKSFDENEKPDLVIKMNEAYTLKTDGTEEFISFIFHPKINSPKLIRKIMIKPGNKKAVHHARLELDEIGVFDKMANHKDFFYTNTILDSMVLSASKIAFYVPGLNYLKFPKNTGILLNPNATLALHLHYAPVYSEVKDQSEIWFYFEKQNDSTRKVICDAQTMMDNTVKIPPNLVTKLMYNCNPFKDSITILAVEPHMHLIGKTFSAWLIYPNLVDSLELITIPDWDFNWQEFYFFKKAIIAPKGSFIRLNAIYDNTSNNPKNPFYPPQEINFGAMNTTNEMLGLLVQFLKYKEGDEKIDFSQKY
jgi:hypothetical protein